MTTKIIAALALLLVAIVVFIVWASRGDVTVGTIEGKIESLDGAAERPAGEDVTIMTWNISFAQGPGSEGVDYKQRSKEEMERALDGMATVIRESKANIVLFQEVDFASKKSHYLDQLKILAEKTGLKYMASAFQWDKNYVPFPYWPPSSHFGAVLSGGAVLSAFPIESNRVTLYENPKANPWWYNLFYPNRFSQVLKIATPKRKFSIVNLHLEAFDQESRVLQAREIADSIKKINENGGDIVLVGGDFNTTPPNAKSKEFGVENYANDPTWNIFQGAPGFKEMVSLEEYAANEKEYFTFINGDWDRRLDYLFVRDSVDVISKSFPKPAEPLSDHRPVVVTFRFKNL